MKRNEFKLLLEDWKKNFIAESPEDPHGVQQRLGQDDLAFASDYDYLDSDSVETMDDMYTSGDFSDLDSDDKSFARDGVGSEDEYRTYSIDDEEAINGFSGVYDDDPTYTPGDYLFYGRL